MNTSKKESMNTLLSRITPSAAVVGLLLAALVAALVDPSQAQASEPKSFRLGVLAGQLGLFGDPGEKGANNIALGASAGYQLDENLALEIQVIQSSHAGVDHRNLSVGGDYYFGDYETSYPHVSAGMSFINNQFKVDGRQSDAAAIYVGGGLEFELQRNLTLGPQFRYNKAFETTATVAGRDIKTVQDSYSLLLRVLYSFGTE